MSEEKSRKGGKSTSPKVVKKSEIGSPKSEEDNSAPDSYRDDIPIIIETNSELNESEITKSDPDSYRDENRKSEMEVHHHPEVEKKGFKEYAFEGLMIFLAVTMGFFAENLREHLDNSDDTAKSMHAMVSDLKSDMLMYQYVLTDNEYCAHMNDTLIAMLSQRSAKTGHIYFLARNITASFEFVRPNTRTFEQLKSSGSLHFINDQRILDSITFYYQSIKWLDKQNDVLIQKVNDVHLANSQLFDGAVFEKIFTGGYANKEKTLMVVSEPANNPPLLSNDHIVINNVIMGYHYLGSILKENDGVTVVNMERCKRLISYLENNYK